MVGRRILAEGGAAPAPWAGTGTDAVAGADAEWAPAPGKNFRGKCGVEKAQPGAAQIPGPSGSLLGAGMRPIGSHRVPVLVLFQTSSQSDLEQSTPEPDSPQEPPGEWPPRAPLARLQTRSCKHPCPHPWFCPADSSRLCPPPAHTRSRRDRAALGHPNSISRGTGERRISSLWPSAPRCCLQDPPVPSLVLGHSSVVSWLHADGPSPTPRQAEEDAAAAALALSSSERAPLAKPRSLWGGSGALGRGALLGLNPRAGPRH